MKQKRYYVYPYLIVLCWFMVALILVGGTICALSTGDWLMPFCILSPIIPALRWPYGARATAPAGSRWMRKPSPCMPFSGGR